MKTIRRIIIENEEKVLEGENGKYFDFDGKRIVLNDSIHLCPTVPKVIVCIHLNYKSRLNELERKQPEAPTYFLKPASCINSHLQNVIRPQGCKFLNYEGEIALVVGQKAKNIQISEAADYIWGYTIANDFGLHDFRETDENSMVRVKGTDSLGVVGPELCIGWDYKGKYIKTYVDDKIVQEANTNDMIWSPEYLLADLSRSITFEKGDVILTGTPANSRPVNPGSIVKVEVEGLGILQNTIVEEREHIINGYGAQPKDTHHIRSISLGSDNKKE